MNSCVWGIGPPTTCTNLWDNNSWSKWEDLFRPIGYNGDKYDQVAFDSFKLAIYNELRASFGMAPSAILR